MTGAGLPPGASGTVRRQFGLSQLGGVAGILVGTGLGYCWAPHNARTGPPKSHRPNMHRGEGLTPAPVPSTSLPNPYTRCPSLTSPGQPVLAASRSDRTINRRGPVPTKGPVWCPLWGRGGDRNTQGWSYPPWHKPLHTQCFCRSVIMKSSRERPAV